MKRIYIRAGLSPLENYSPIQLLKNNAIGDNVGNLIYAYSVFRSLMTDEDTEIVANHYKVDPKDADKINDEYDYFVIPLADAFRKDFVGEMHRTTELIKKLKIPCVILGVGLRAPFEPKLNESFVFDEEVKDFIKAVLDKSAIVGVRGEITSSYLSRLGFREEIDHTVIGCPSMYMFGKELPKPNKAVLTKESRVCINYKIELPQKLHQFIDRCRKELPKFTFIPQSIEELRLLYAGYPYPVEKHKSIPKKYPVTISSKPYLRDKVKGFVNVPEWLDYLKENDFSFGSRIHGNIAAALAGIPCYIFVYDARILELAKYHNIPYQLADTINTETNIFDIYERTDFNCILRGHKERFLHFLDFLNINGLETIYDSEGNSTYAPFDKKIESLKLEPPIRSISSLDWKEREERMKLYYGFLNSKKEEFRLNNIQLKDENKQLKAELAIMKQKEKERNNSFHRRLLRKLAL